MVNLEKWEVVEHEDVKLGDNLKIVWTKATETLKTKETHTGTVRSINSLGEFHVNGVCWAPGEPYKGTTTTLYRRKVEVKPFVFPTGKGAIIEGQGRNGKVELFHVGNGRWYSLVNTGIYGQITLEATLSNLRVVTAGLI